MIFPLAFISSVTVVDSPPTAGFDPDSEFIERYSSVFLTDTSTGNPTTWKWYVNGVFHSISRNTSVWFSTTGINSITLLVENEFGSDSVTKRIEVVEEGTIP